MPTPLWRPIAVASMLSCATLSFAARAVSAQAVDPTAALLSELIRVNTSNPPGQTLALDELLAARFKAVGYSVEIISTPDKDKSHFIARLARGRHDRSACR